MATSEMEDGGCFSLAVQRCRYRVFGAYAARVASTDGAGEPSASTVVVGDGVCRTAAHVLLNTSASEGPSGGQVWVMGAVDIHDAKANRDVGTEIARASRVHLGQLIPLAMPRQPSTSSIQRSPWRMRNPKLQQRQVP